MSTYHAAAKDAVQLTSCISQHWERFHLAACETDVAWWCIILLQKVVFGIKCHMPKSLTKQQYVMTSEWEQAEIIYLPFFWGPMGHLQGPVGVPRLLVENHRFTRLAKMIILYELFRIATCHVICHYEPLLRHLLFYLIHSIRFVGLYVLSNNL